MLLGGSSLTRDVRYCLQVSTGTLGFSICRDMLMTLGFPICRDMLVDTGISPVEWIV